MSDSLRDQLLQAGFKQPAQDSKKHKRSSSKNNAHGKNSKRTSDHEKKKLESRKKAEAESLALAKKEMQRSASNSLPVRSASRVSMALPVLCLNTSSIK